MMSLYQYGNRCAEIVVIFFLPLSFLKHSIGVRTRLNKDYSTHGHILVACRWVIAHSIDSVSVYIH